MDRNPECNGGVRGHVLLREEGMHDWSVEMGQHGTRQPAPHTTYQETTRTAAGGELWTPGFT